MLQKSKPTVNLMTIEQSNTTMERNYFWFSFETLYCGRKMGGFILSNEAR